MVKEYQWGDFECLHKACQAAWTDGGLFTDTGVDERCGNERQDENEGAMKTVAGSKGQRTDESYESYEQGSVQDNHIAGDVTVIQMLSTNRTLALMWSTQIAFSSRFFLPLFVTIIRSTIDLLAYCSSAMRSIGHRHLTASSHWKKRAAAVTHWSIDYRPETNHCRSSPSIDILIRNSVVTYRYVSRHVTIHVTLINDTTDRVVEEMRGSPCLSPAAGDCSS